MQHPTPRAGVALHGQRRPRRPARQHLQHQGGAALRRLELRGAGAPPAGAPARAARTGGARGRQRRALPAAQPRARPAPPAGPHRRGAARRGPAPPDPPEPGLTDQAGRPEAPPRRDQAPTPRRQRRRLTRPALLTTSICTQESLTSDAFAAWLDLLPLEPMAIGTYSTPR